MHLAKEITRREIGALVLHHAVAYRVWAPDAKAVAVHVEVKGGSRRVELASEADGYWSQLDEIGQAGDLYRLELDGKPPIPDAASRFQPQGVHGPSECVDPSGYKWQCSWKRPGWAGQTTYEIHIGTFTADGTFSSAIARLDHLKKLGVDAVEIMPLADFAGERNWGYDGVALFAPARCYGRPDDLRAFVDAAHGWGLAVILDVVFNHLGPQGNYLPQYCLDYFRRDRHTPWGSAFNLDGPRSGPVREYILTNVRHWLDEYRFDGLRLDATHSISDESDRHILEEITVTAHDRKAFVIAEDERNNTKMFDFGRGTGVDAVWADDFHHQVRVALTGTRHAYFAGYSGTANDLADTIAHGWAYRGKPYLPWGGRIRGEPCAYLPTKSFVFCIENHDQVGNRAQGERLEHLITPGQFRAASMLLCLGPYPVLIFMGQDWAASSPFLFFTDHGGELGRDITAGRLREFGVNPETQVRNTPDPEALSSFEESKLRWDDLAKAPHSQVLNLYGACLSLRRTLARLGALDRDHWKVEANRGLLRIEYRTSQGQFLLLAGLSAETELPDVAKEKSRGTLILCSNAEQFGGDCREGFGGDRGYKGAFALFYGVTSAEEELWR